MKRNQNVNPLKLTIAEPFPVVPAYKPGMSDRLGEAQGPFFAAGATWYYPLRTREHVERMAIHLRSLGYTVTVSV